MQCAFDENRCLQKYESVTQILKNFYKIRLETYHKRKDYLEGILQAEAGKLSNQARFILEKCDGTLVIENKKKKDMIAELVRRNYESDPVLAWKLTQNREEVLDEVAEETTEDTPSSSAAIQKNNFDYLLGMTLWSLTKERKDDILRQRDEKIAELKRLQARTPISLWKEDLDNLLSELNKFEEKEKKEENKTRQNIKKPPAKFYKQEDTRRIVPVIDTELKKKIEKADIVSKDKKEGIKRQPKIKKEPIEEKDEFDALVESNKPIDEKLNVKAEKKSGAKKGMKQTTLPFKTLKKSKKKYSDSDSNEFDSNEIDFDSISPVRSPRRAAASKRNYALSSDESDAASENLYSLSSDSEQVRKPKHTIALSDSDDDFKIDKKPPPPKSSPEELFDSLVGNTPDKSQKPAVSSSGEDNSLVMFTPPKKVPSKKKAENGGAKATKRQMKKKMKSSDSENDDNSLASKTKPNKKRMKMSDSESENTIEVSPVVPTRKNSARNRKPVSYALKSDEESDSD